MRRSGTDLTFGLSNILQYFGPLNSSSSFTGQCKEGEERERGARAAKLSSWRKQGSIKTFWEDFGRIYTLLCEEAKLLGGEEEREEEK